MWFIWILVFILIACIVQTVRLYLQGQEAVKKVEVALKKVTQNAEIIRDNLSKTLRLAEIDKDEVAEDKAYIAKAVLDNWTNETRFAVLTAAHPQLDGQSILAALIDGKVDDVTAIFERLESGAYL